MADCRTFFTSLAMRLREKVSVAKAVSADFPRIDCATRLSLRGLVRMLRPTARACASESERLRAGLPIGRRRCRRPLCRCGAGDLRFAVAGMTVEDARRRELAEFVTDHILGHV